MSLTKILPRVLSVNRYMSTVFSYSFRYAARFDCGCQYKYKVSLLNADKQVLDSYDFKDEKPSGRDWFSVN